jgi:SAM-dependent methyltransferase
MLSQVKTLIKKNLFRERYEQEREMAELELMMGFRGQYLSHRNFQFDLVKRLGLNSKSKVLEVGFGPLTLGLPLVDFLDVNCYHGVDVRPNVVDTAHKLVGKAQLGYKNPVLLHSESFGLEELHDEKFDFVFAFSVLYHLEDQLLDQLISPVARRLAKGGSLIANINVHHEPSRWLEFPFQQRPLAFYENKARNGGLKLQVLGDGTQLGMSETDAASKNYYLRLDPS